MAYHRSHGVDTRIVRIFNTYGPRMRLSDGRVVPNFVGQALRQEPLTVYGEGKQTRSFCYVSDLVDGIYRLLLSDENEPVNIGNPAELTIHDFATGDQRADRQPGRHPLRAAAGGRPQAAPARHRQGAAHPWLGAEGGPAHGDDADGGMVQKPVGRAGVDGPFTTR